VAPWRKGNRLRRIPESDAHGQVKQVYDDTKLALGLPYVDFVFQAFGRYPTFLELHWRSLKPVVESQQFFDLAERLRADGYTRVHSYFRVPDLCAEIGSLGLDAATRKEITSVVDLYHYGRALVLLTLAAQYQAFEAPVGQDTTRILPASHPVFSETPVLIEEEAAPPSTRRIFDELKHNLHLPFLPGEYRAFARWPVFLEAYWQSLKPVIESPVYEGSQHALRETAFSLASEFPCPVKLSISDLSEAGMSDADITSVVRITELLVRSLSASVLNVAVAKIGTEGGTGTLPRQRSRSEDERAA
jgi:Halocarboxylic acid dehydrogenase DehI